MSCPSKSDKCFARAAEVAATCNSRGGGTAYCMALSAIAFRNCMNETHDSTNSSTGNFTTTQYTNIQGRNCVRRPECRK